MNCPECDSIIYSRRSGRCGVCGAALPQDCLFTDEQRAKIEAPMKEDEMRHKEALSKIAQIPNGEIGL